jgi:ribosomal protein S18 acetylase RimI-like enzyme
MSSMEIKIMTMADYPEIFELWNSTAGVGMRSLDDSENGIRIFLSRNPSTCFIAREGGELTGVLLAGHDGRRAYIYHTAVRENYRKRGIGRALVNAAEKAMRAEGIHKIALVAFASNENGNRFWEKMGYILRQDLVYRNKSFNEKNT